jgi:hypothetical protein
MNSLLGTEFESYDILSNAIVCSKTAAMKSIFSQALAELVFNEWESEDQYRESHSEVLSVADAILKAAGK